MMVIILWSGSGIGIMIFYDQRRAFVRKDISGALKM
jgi:hypothetical protein